LLSSWFSHSSCSPLPFPFHLRPQIQYILFPLFSPFSSLSFFLFFRSYFLRHLSLSTLHSACQSQRFYVLPSSSWPRVSIPSARKSVEKKAESMLTRRGRRLRFPFDSRGFKRLLPRYRPDCNVVQLERKKRSLVALLELFPRFLNFRRLSRACSATRSAFHEHSLADQQPSPHSPSPSASLSTPVAFSSPPPSAPSPPHLPTPAQKWLNQPRPSSTRPLTPSRGPPWRVSSSVASSTLRRSKSTAVRLSPSPPLHTS
jgi:hypothetical protein